MINYDKQSDMLDIRLKDEPCIDSEEIADGIVVDYGSNGIIVGLQIDGAAKKMGLL